MFANIAFLLHKSIKRLLYLSFCNVRVWTYLHMKGIIMQKSRIKMQTNELFIYFVYIPTINICKFKR